MWQISCLTILFLDTNVDALLIKSEQPIAVNGDGSKKPHAAHEKPGECIKMLKPNLLFIGQAYSGSTTLADQMLLHPQLDFGRRKEHKYFRAKYDSIKNENKYKQYLEEFWVGCNTTVAYDATMDYLEMAADEKYGLDAVKYVRQRLGGSLRIMVMLRNPVEVMLHKACTYGKHKGYDKLSADNPPNGSRTVSNALSTWLKVFPNKKNWLFLSSDKFFVDPQTELNRIFKFVGVKSTKLAEEELAAQSGRRRCKATSSSEERNAYWSMKSNKDDKKTLEMLTGLKFHWSSH